jgi:hypothetical protein
MGMESARAGLGPRRRWRQFVGAVAIYALVIQSVLLAAFCVPLAANASAGAGLPAFELCLHGGDNGPLSPADQPGQHPGNHCIFCFAGTHHSLAAPPQFSIQQVTMEIGSHWQPENPWRLATFSQYSVARPRGPPLSA